MSIRSYLILMRPANIITAIADILAGLSIAGLSIAGFLSNNIPIGGIALILSTIGLYGGGIVFNDVFDIGLDKVERPERPLPSGKVSLFQAQILGIGLLVMGIIAAFFVSKISGLIAIIIAILALTYDKFSKHYTFLGPLNMGLCRSFNLLLGISISSVALFNYWYLAIIPLIFIADITLTSQGEVKGQNQNALYLALFLDFMVISIFFALPYFSSFQILIAFPFIALWLWMNSVSKLKAIQDNQPNKVQNAVKMGVLSLIPMNAAFAAGFQGWEVGFLVLLLLPISLGLAKYFSVT